MTADIVIDEDGEPWPVDSPALARRLGYRDARLGLADFAVSELGFVHIRPIENGVRVTLRPGAFNAVTLAGTLQALNDMGPRRILLVVGSGDDRLVELFTSIFDFIERAEGLGSDPPIEPKVPRLSVPRGLRNLTTAPFAVFRPIVELWRERRGVLTDDVYRAMLRDGAYDRAVLARQLPRSSRFIIEHLGAGHHHLRPCEALRTIGREVQEQPDQQYGAWIGEAYDEASSGRRLRIDSVRAEVSTSAATLLRARYDRLLMPWRARGDVLVLAVSIRRELSVVA
jgi:hypothetical protein